MTSAKQEKRRRQREARRQKSGQSLAEGSRVLLERPVEPELATESVDDRRAWLEQRNEALGEAIHPIVRLTEDGPDWGAAPSAEDEIGYAVHPFRMDQCFQSAIATAAQIPIEQVPDLHVDDRLYRRGEDPEEISRTAWLRIEEWLGSRGLKLRFWMDGLPITRRRWIGVVRAGSGHFEDHCLVMSRDRVLFDPVCSVVPPAGSELLTHTPNAVSYGLTLDKRR